jgi:hypothetical protein
MIAACGLVVGVEDRKVDPVLAGCNLPASGPAQIRLANLLPSKDVVDVCIAPAGEPYFRPLYRGAGSSCDPGSTGQPGLAYSKVTGPIYAPSTTVDIRFIPAGQVCSAPALSEKKGVALAPNVVTTVLRVGGAGTPEDILALPESTVTNDTARGRIRFVHVAPGIRPLAIGQPAQPYLPTTLQARFIPSAVEYGKPLPSGLATSLGSVAENGYLVSTRKQKLSIGLGYDDDPPPPRALINFGLTREVNTLSVYVIGAITQDNAYPLRALICVEDLDFKDGPPCLLSTLAVISVTSLNTQMFGRTAPYQAERLPHLANALANHDADLQCLVEVTRKSERQAIAEAAAKGNYPYAYFPDTDSTTPPTDPRDQAGNIPTDEAVPACSADNAPSVDKFYSCVQSNCNTNAPSPDGRYEGSVQCLVSKCAGTFLDLYSNYHRCFDCLILRAQSDDTFAEQHNKCMTDTKPTYFFDGQTTQMILSKHPLSKQEVFVLPSTNHRKAILYSQVTLEDQTVDFFCAYLIATSLNTDLPYTGHYDDGNQAIGYTNEQAFQAQKVIEWVKKKTAESGHPAIIAGDWYSSLEYNDLSTNTKTIEAVNPDTINKFRNEKAFTVATPAPTEQGPAWIPSCTYCPEKGGEHPNWYNRGVSTGTLTLETYLKGFPPNATTEQSIVFTEAVVPIPSAGPGAPPGAISLNYGMNVRVQRPSASK